MPRYAFSSGQVRVGSAGVTGLGTASIVGAVQSFAVNVDFANAQVREAASVNVYPECIKHYEGNVTADMEFVDMAGTALTMFAGFTGATANGSALYTLSAGSTNVPPLGRLEFWGKDCEDKDVIVIIARGKANGINMPRSRTDFGTNSITFMSVPTRGTGTATDEALRIQQQN